MGILGGPSRVGSAVWPHGRMSVSAVGVPVRGCEHRLLHDALTSPLMRPSQPKGGCFVTFLLLLALSCCSGQRTRENICPHLELQ